MTEMSLKDFALHLQKVVGNHAKYEAEAAFIAGELLEESAKHKIGHLQKEFGPFPAWEPLKESTIRDKERLGFLFNEEGNPLLRTGKTRDSISHSYDPLTHMLYLGSPSMVLLYQEEGTVHIPARSVLAITMFQAEPIVENVFKHMLKSWITNKPLSRTIATQGITHE